MNAITICRSVSLRIPNLVSEFNSDKIWPPFWQKKTVESWQNTPFCQFWAFFHQKGIKCYSILIWRADLGSSHQRASLIPHNERGLETLFLAP